MAKFCFISFQQPGHMDFGGLGFVHIARHLIKRGHRVRWVFSISEYEDHSRRLYQLLKKFEIDFDHVSKFYLTFSHHQKDIRESTAELAQYIRAEKYDCLVIDRLCVGAAFAASAAGIPWATIGSDGREWSFCRSPMTDGFTLLPQPYRSPKFPLFGEKSDTASRPGPSTYSYWATSPFLNMSFFPRSYYEDGNGQALPPQSHFLGCGPIPAPKGHGTSLLVTFGNSFNPVLREKLLRAIKSETRRSAISTLILTGSKTLTRNLTKEFCDLDRVTIKNWMPYDHAYQAARLAIGHGGTAHVWYGLREGVPLLVIPFVGDQPFNGRQVERLNIGRTMYPRSMPWPLPGPLRRIGNRIPERFRINLSRRDCQRNIDDLFEDEGIRGSCLDMSRRMRLGGGAAAGACLLDRLANEKTPITACTIPNCCC